METSEDYYALRVSLRKPISELFDAAKTIEVAVDAHLKGQRTEAAELLMNTNTPTVRDYIESLWGSPKKYPEQVHYLRRRVLKALPPKNPKAKDRMPTKSQKIALIQRDGYICRYCSLNLIPADARKLLHAEYPDALPWGSKNDSQHAAFQALWLQYDHVIPAAFGGDSSLENMVISCAGCNFAKWKFHLEELGLSDPRERAPVERNWNGLAQLSQAILL